MRKTTTSLPSVGFDRFIELEWANFALDLALTGGGPSEIKDWLSKRIEGKDARRKTANLLTNLWLREYAETSHLRSEALALADSVAFDQYIVFHWGMALANFSLFSQTVEVIGRLIRIQGDFERLEVRKRVLESYSNQGTIPRSVDRIIQSLCNWSIIQKKGKNVHYVQNTFSVKRAEVLIWLIKCLVNNDPKREVTIIDIARYPKLFPFEFGVDIRAVLYQSDDFEIIRSGRNEELAILKNDGMGAVKNSI